MTRAVDLYAHAAELYDRQLWEPARKLYEAADALLVIEAFDREIEAEHPRPTGLETEHP